MTATGQAKRGPKRSEQSRLAILTAAFELSRDEGYRNLTIEGIAARAGVGKQTVYRWWDSKADVLLEAGAIKADLYVSVEDRGSWRADLSQFLSDSYALLAKAGLAPLLRSLMAEAQLDPGFAQRFRDGFLLRRRAALSELIDRARDRGDAPAGLPATTILDTVFGTIWYRLLTSDELPTAADIPPLLDLLAPTPRKNRHG